VHWKRSFVEQGFKDPEITGAQVERPDMPFGHRPYRPGGLPQDQPKMYATWRPLGTGLGLLLACHICLDIEMLEIKKSCRRMEAAVNGPVYPED
jgi:hypothetical protein